ncbi:MAG: DUF3089 domain-containing protein [Elusimicrobiota bacterium]|jgi:hypothetical protein|nr:DUF3089 domain-containing protein [Elusimicrobiota bacterium]
MIKNRKNYCLRLLGILSVAVFLFTAVACTNTAATKEQSQSQTAQQTQYVPMHGDNIAPSDYADKNNWLALPKNINKLSKAADVFYIYPTTWVAQKGQYPIADIDLKMMRDGAKNTFQVQATAFETAGNIFAPFYRQLDADFLLSITDPVQQDKYTFGVPATDVEAAFDYYIKNYNNGRPFIIAGHSQGAVMTKYLLFRYLKNHPEVAKRMVAAYVMGYSVSKQELKANPHLKFAENADDTGVVISFNTEAPNLTIKNYTVLKDAVVINPISWTRDETEAPASQNLGSRLQIDGKFQTFKNLADAKVNKKRGTVVCSTVNPQDYFEPDNALVKFFAPGIYHMYEVQFYYYNLRQNAENRVKQYFNKTKNTQSDTKK